MTITAILLTITNAKHLLILLLIVIPLVDLKVVKCLKVYIFQQPSGQGQENRCFFPA
jgi:hypothetical protein